MKEETNLDNRDENDLNSYVKILFDDVLAEPGGSHSPDCLWITSDQCFTCGKNCIYKTFSSLCGICIALAWGCEFGWIIFQHVWCYTPCLRVIAIYCACSQKYFGTIIACCLAPFCETCALFFSRINVYNQPNVNV